MTTRADASVTLLQRLMDDAIDPDYLIAAQRPERRTSNWRHSTLFAVAVAVTGALTAAAVVQVREGAPSAGETRSELADRVVAATTEVRSLDSSVDAVARQVASLQAQALDGTAADRALADQVAALQQEVGAAPVTGDGAVVVLDDGQPTTDGNGGPDLARVLDTDLQTAVNGLFAAGATAVSVNGQRLTALSPIRSAGDAVLVGFRPLVPPYSITAIGPSSMVPEFESGAARSTLQTLEDTYGMRVDVVPKADVTVPGAGMVVTRVAQPTSEEGGRP